MISFKKKKKKVKPDEGQRMLASVATGLKIGEPNSDIAHIQKVLELATSGNYEKKIKDPVKKKLDENHENFLKIMKKSQEDFDAKQKKQLKEFQRQKKFWYRMKYKVRAKYRVFKLHMKEIGAFIKHEFYTVRRLIFLIHNLFFGAQYKNRKLFYSYKDQVIKAHGYMKGEIRYNSLIRNLTKGAELNKKLIEGNY